ncbi:DNA circularization protein [Flavisphingomonas formosensis]|uniref:DNA circularization protein n=1 Tax=Flavisphingomonas formosensis TaxID=861534 RepID=UPI0012F8B144|nr:DNA circularization N-terminal domain-containing protein [Sphingomonas formosensis]
MALFSNGLLPASFRGVPFAVARSANEGGRRVVVHEYPGRDLPSTEDMGRGARRFSFNGFLVEGDLVYLGGPVQLQRALLLAALEAKGPGILTHPTLGILNVNVLRYSMDEDLGAGRMSEISLAFVESGKKSLASVFAATDAGVLSAATIAKIAIVADIARVLVSALSGGGTHSGISSSASQWSGQTTALAGDATAINKLTARLPGNNGRFTSGANAGFTTAANDAYSADATVASLIVQASEQRQDVAAAAATLAAAVATLGIGATETDVGNAAGDLVDALVNACADPADALRLLAKLLAFSPAGIDAAGTTGSAITALFQRMIAVALAVSSARYQPSSYDDAFKTLVLVTSLIDTVATAAADAGQDSTYDVLRDLRIAVTQDLKARGATLAPIRSFNVPRSRSALALAQSIYRDASRADQLIAQVVPVSPLFMPPSFQALAS